MSDDLNTKSIKRLLDRSTASLDQPTLAKLREARTQALLRHEARSTVPAFAWAGAAIGSANATESHRSHYYWASIILFVAASLFGTITYWQHLQENDDSDVDIAILTDDMPVDVYVD